MLSPRNTMQEYFKYVRRIPMGKITRNNIIFDSELEINYYDYLTEKGVNFIYHPIKSILINSKNRYYPDFIEIHEHIIYITETKGYNPYSKLKDDMIHNAMLDKPNHELRTYINSLKINIDGKEIIYRKIKFLKNYGFVDFDFKNPNSLLNNRRNKIKELEYENKILRDQVKNFNRYFGYLQKSKLTKPQQLWFDNFISNYNKNQDDLV